jgi:putative ABC transport system substrate-binding protein
MRRRDFLSLLACGAVFPPLAAFAQQSEQLRQVAVLIGLSESDPEAPSRVQAFQQGLEALGWVDRRNIQVTYRLAAEEQQLRSAAQELVALRPDVLVAGSSIIVSALLRETRTIPIVFATASDPVGDGFVASLARPGGNATGFTNSNATMGGKWLELIREVSPAVSRAAILFNRETAPAGGVYFLQAIEGAAASVGLPMVPTQVREPGQLEGAFREIAREPGGSLIVLPDHFTTVNRSQIIAQAAQHRLPAVYPLRYFATEGGLMAYGPDLVDLYRRTGSYVDRILRGARPGELPVQAPAKFDLVINLRAARQSGLMISRILLARADEVIE